MEIDCIRYSDINFLNPLVSDYLNQGQDTRPFYQAFPSVENFQQPINNKQFSDHHRKVLVEVLKGQYTNIKENRQALRQIDKLADSNTFTVTTGHQLCLFTGPLYFVYKILSAVKLSRQLKEAYPDKEFVPVYWMASEDHDFEEINHFVTKGKRYNWPGENTTGVGRLTPELEDLKNELKQDLGPGTNADKLVDLFYEAYCKGLTLSSGTRWLVNELFAQYAVVVIDADDARLKTLFAPSIKAELNNQIAFHHVSATNEKLSALGYNIQVTPRDINLFYLTDESRIRITKSDNGFELSDNSKHWTESEIIQEVDTHPERFSPNVLLRPVYQETILPNLAYIGGAGELSYWFEMKAMFEAFEVEFPIIMLRNSAVVLTERTSAKWQKLGFTNSDFFKPVLELENQLVNRETTYSTSTQNEQESLIRLFDQLKQRAEGIDKTLGQSTEAERTKALKTLARLEKKMQRAEKRHYQESIERLHTIYDQVFPNGTFQERKVNFSEVYLNEGWKVFDDLLESFNSLRPEITFDSV